MTKSMIETEALYIPGEGLHMAPGEGKQGHLRPQSFPAGPVH